MKRETPNVGTARAMFCRGRFCLPCSVSVIMVLFLNKRLNGPKKPAHLGEHYCTVHKGGFRSVYRMSVAIWSGVASQRSFGVCDKTRPYRRLHTVMNRIPPWELGALSVMLDV